MIRINIRWTGETTEFPYAETFLGSPPDIESRITEWVRASNFAGAFDFPLPNIATGKHVVLK